jgi:hypothetical protein
MDTTKYTEEVTPTELRNAYEVAYGEHGAYHLIGALFANLPYETIERLYDQAIEKVRDDMRVAGHL